MLQRMNRAFHHKRTSAGFALSLVLLVFVQHSRADYVETAPRPGAPLPPSIIPGECPLVFLKADIQYAKQTACSSGPGDSGTSNAIAVSAAGAFSNSSITSCCIHMKAVLWQARVRYANETGRLLLPQASADACIQSLNTSAIAAGLPALGWCDIKSQMLSEDAGKACGDDLTTVYDFWSASSRTFPGTVGTSCYGENADCGLCTTLITNKIMSLGSSTPALLATTSCQDLAQVAMAAAAYPVAIANGIARCLYNVDIEPIPQASKCTAYDWSRQNWTSIVRSCGAESYRADRCCQLVHGQYHFMLVTALNKTRYGMDQGQAEVCFSEYKAGLAAHGVSPATPESCRVTAATALLNIGCYNYSTLQQQVSTRYFHYFDGNCTHSGGGDCSHCSQTLLDVGNELANTTSVAYLNACQQLVVHQYYLWLANVESVPERGNCYYQFPPGLELTMVPLLPSKSASNIALIAGVSCASAVVLLGVLAIVAFVLWRRYPLYKAEWDAEKKTLGRLSSIQQRVVGNRLQVFTKRQLSKATQDFSESRVVGVGGSGKVYVGELNGDIVAVKDSTFGSNNDGAKEAWNEVATLAQYRHRHLVVLKGCCLTGSNSFLVYEFMEQGSVEDHLCPTAAVSAGRATESSVRAQFLNWPTRDKIALGTAKGLAYLHEECKPRCIHRDVKLSNILLANDFEPKLADFGLARRTDPQDTHVTTAIAGTWGYLSPEYMATGKLTEKSDVYSFGVVLLCLVAGRRPTQSNAPEEQVHILKIHLAEWAWALAERSELEQLIDPRLEGERHEFAANMERMTKVALLCVHTAASVRPSMRQCADMLMGRMEVPRLPRRLPSLYTVSSLASSDPESSAGLSSGQLSSILSRGAGILSMSSDYDPKSVP
ncbi:Protein kinase superfamily protein [Klebsormidium nitens]|uniref:Protein kinase superfamily protein n=1 Tax=Klebsormidium nitens TaxID=105231 RepID=A0A1Y1HIZ9_KLENI|nr:Protein kinase superfamily protein [Klebsormidium nitens]|eukprot:GAQ77883.1 Protein kinase superfamily protein [Klebsormidium nitens]